MLPQVVKLRGIALNLLFPRWCVGCGNEGSFICPSCLHSLARIEPPVCPLCGRPRHHEGLCTDCAGWEASIDGIRSPFIFEGLIRTAIHHLKYRNLKAIAETLATLLKDYLETLPLTADTLVPMPLHPKRLRDRGYNQSELIARELGRLTGMPVSTESLIRERYSLPQARTGSVEERKHNVRNAFAFHGNDFREKRILLIDDVATSGATLDAASAALKRAGAASVWGLVVAREI